MTIEKQTTEVEVGQTAPDFGARNVDDQRVDIKALIGRRRALLLFYRGGWCPFCNKQLASISEDRQLFSETGATIVAVNGEEVAKGKELLKRLSLPFTLLSDIEFEGIDRYGVRDNNPAGYLRAKGITRLSKPAAFIIDETGVVRYKHVGKNPQDCPKNDDLLRVLRELRMSTGPNSSSPEGTDACEL